MTNAPRAIESSALDGVRFGRVERHEDERGSFRELWRASWFSELDRSVTGGPEARFVQANMSASAPGVLRGLHYHRHQLDYWVVASGQVFLALVDVRPVLAARAGQPIVETRELAADDWVVIPVGIAHGFLALEPIELVYLVTAEYDSSDELGFAWDDPAVAVPWPIGDGPTGKAPVLSERDRANPPLAELVLRLRS